jgi:hypothetical protein
VTAAERFNPGVVGGILGQCFAFGQVLQLVRVVVQVVGLDLAPSYST